MEEERKVAEHRLKEERERIQYEAEHEKSMMVQQKQEIEGRLEAAKKVVCMIRATTKKACL